MGGILVVECQVIFQNHCLLEQTSSCVVFIVLKHVLILVEVNLCLPTSRRYTITWIMSINAIAKMPHTIDTRVRKIFNFNCSLT